SPHVRATRYSLTANVLGAVFGLILLMYLVTLTGLGFSLRERAQQNLELAAERELSAIMTVIQDQVLLRDYPAIEQLIAARVNHEHILLARFASPSFTFEARTPPTLQHYPGWFARLLELPAPHVESELMLGGSPYGTVSVGLDPAATINGLWVMAVRFTWQMIIGLAISMAMLNWLLGRNRRGLFALREAARAIEGGNLGARVSLAHGSSPEVRETKLAFNHMADHVSQLVNALESEHADLLVEKERLRVTIESIGDAVIVTDARGLIEFINPKAEELTGYSSIDAHGRPVSEVLPLFNEESGAPVTNPLELALRSNQVVELASHSVIIRPSGATLAISDTAAPILSREGKVQGGVLVFHDDSEMRSLMQRLARQAERDHLTGLSSW
ncbi:MAG: hypothetical protein H6R08_2478, partial [Proteobacteria bacterium]|nr:hypothetical protein [Pseudomonadota bacterium]